MPSQMLKVFLLDDHAMFRRGLRRLIEEMSMTVELQEAAGGPEALEKLGTFEADVALVDIVLAGMDGIEVTRRILEMRPATRVIVLSAYSDLNRVRDALQVGAQGYIIKANAPEELERAMRAVLDHRVYLCPEIASAVAAGYLEMQAVASAPAGKPTLTERERLLLRLVAEGKRSKEIAEELGVTPKSVETFRSRLMKKLDCANATELTRYALREGIASL